jgi:hypothetical protein
MNMKDELIKLGKIMGYIIALSVSVHVVMQGLRYLTG